MNTVPKIMMLLAALAVSTVGVAQSMDATVERAIAEFEEWMEAIADLTRGVEVSEADLREFLDHWEDMNDLEVMQEEGDDETDVQQFKMDLREVLADPEYRSWAAANGLDPEDWLRSSMRITSVMMMVQWQENRESAKAQQQEYAAMVEQQCAQVDDELCQQMRAGLAASRAMSAAMEQAQGKLRPPTTAERELITRYGDVIEATMMSDEFEEEYEEYGEYEDEE